MPSYKPVSELRRNLEALSSECHETREPVYFIKNGSASLILMDAQAFDQRLALVERVQEREERVARVIARGYDDLLNGRVRPWFRAKGDADRIREVGRA